MTEAGYTPTADDHVATIRDAVVALRGMGASALAREALETEIVALDGEGRGDLGLIPDLADALQRALQAHAAVDLTATVETALIAIVEAAYRHLARERSGQRQMLIAHATAEMLMRRVEMRTGLPWLDVDGWRTQ